MRLLTAALIALLAVSTHAAEIIRLTAQNFDDVAPKGKEVDAIIGDYVLRSGKLIAVVADTVDGRKANMSTKNVAGSLIDFTTRTNQNDQLTCVYTSLNVPLTKATIANASGSRVELVCEAPATETTPAVKVTYTLSELDDFLRVKTEVTNTSGKPLTIEPGDDVRADKTFIGGVDEKGDAAWVTDEWWNQAYGFVSDAPSAKVTLAKGDKPFRIRYANADGGTSVRVEPNQTVGFARRIFVASSSLALRGTIGNTLGLQPKRVKLTVRDSDMFVADANVTLTQGGKTYGTARTDAAGVAEFLVPTGSYDCSVAAIGRPEKTMKLDVAGDLAQRIELEQPGYVVANITAADGGPIPCKVQFIGENGTANPMFFHETGEHAVGNLYYTQHGRFKQPISPGDYTVIVSYGPEYDIIEKHIKVKRGEEAKITGKLVRSVDSRGWVSGEFHSHSTPSGDNTSSQYGRVLNLLCENLEFAPCTEHQRIDSYTPHLKKLGVEHLMATCTGMELTNQLPFNHENAFPLIMKPHTQDNGAPQIDNDPYVQIERLAKWDNNAEKLVQQNHPNIIQIAFDKDQDGKRDEGFNRELKYMDVIEVHSPVGIFNKPTMKKGVASDGNKMQAWLQVINQGRYVPGVINTDSHYNVHGSGYYRNYIKSTTDDPAKIDTLEMVRSCKAGHIVMSTAPFMQVTIESGGKTADPGDTLPATGGATLHVKVQCANWYDINRVQVFINGRAEKSLNFTRQSHPQMFSDKVVRFEQSIPLKLAKDAHVIVAAIGEGTTLSKVYASGGGSKLPPIAVSNPIFVDVDGNGFEPSKDELDAPLPK